MKKNSWLITVILILIIILIFSFGGALQTIVGTGTSLEGYMLIISFLGLLATFGGAYLGAKVAGEYSLKANQLLLDKQTQVSKERAVYLKEDIFLEFMSYINRLRPQDFGFPLNTQNLGIDLNLNPTFRENIYQKVDDDDLLEFQNYINTIKNFRLSDDFYNLSLKEREEITSLVNDLSTLLYLFKDLNNAIDQGLKEPNRFFNAKKNALFDKLDEIYNLRATVIRKKK